MKGKVGILSHGCHTGTPNWEEIIWGKPPDALGRVPKAVQIALREKAELIVFGTGSSEKDGMKEAEYIIHYLLKNFLRLQEFSAFSNMNLAAVREKIARISVPEIISQNTAEEVALVGQIFVAEGVEKVYQVSSPFHIPRCHRDAMVAFKIDPKLRFLPRGLVAAASETGPDPAETIILEPPHRPDRPASRLYKFVQAVQSMSPEKRQEIIDKVLGP